MDPTTLLTRERFCTKLQQRWELAIECITGLDVGAEAVKNPELSCEAEAVEGFLAMNGVENINQEVTAVFDR